MQSLRDVAAVLQIGFSGFAFLMAGLSYRLIQAEASRSGKARAELLATIRRYSTYTLILGILVIIAKLGDQTIQAYIDFQMAIVREREALVSPEARNCSDALSRLVHAEDKVNKTYDSLLQAVQDSRGACTNLLSRLDPAR